LRPSPATFSAGGGKARKNTRIPGKAYLSERKKELISCHLIIGGKRKKRGNKRKKQTAGGSNPS